MNIMSTDMKQNELQIKADITKSARFIEILEIICDNVKEDWKLLGRNLKLTKQILQEIDHEPKTEDKKCWSMLIKWKANKRLNGFVLNEIQDALKHSRLFRLADLTQKIAYSKSPINEILAPNVEREVLMREILLAVTDNVHSDWRHLAISLGLTKLDIATIESKFPGRTREKCMRSLYKWRSLVCLQDYKASSIIQSLKECGLHEQANEISIFASEGNLCYTRRRRKGELLIKIDCIALIISKVKLDDENEFGKAINDDTSKNNNTDRITSEEYRNYARNKIFLYLLDALDDQDRKGTHPLILYLQENRRVILQHVNRRYHYLSLKCTTKADARSIYELYKNGTLSQQLRKLLITTDLLNELSAISIELDVTISEQEYKMCEAELPLHFDNRMNEYFEALPTSRSSISSPRSHKGLTKLPKCAKKSTVK